MHILIAEGDTLLAEGIARTVRDMGHGSTVLADGPAAHDLLDRHAFDLVLLDPALPGLDRAKLLRHTRGDPALPVIVLASAGGTDDWTDELGLGAGDRMVRPVSLRDLATRIQTRLRQAQLQRSIDLVHGPLQLQTRDCRALLAGAPLDLAPPEWQVLEYLLRRPGRVILKSQLLSLPAYRGKAGDGALEACMARLRAKLDAAGVHIRTVRGLGYMLDDCSPA